MAERAEIREVGPRDGLQLVSTILSTERKLEWCARTAAAGVRRIEVTSFVPPSVVPQFADAAEVARGAVAMGGFD
ncbi:MAG: hydroxymethylglutaryl-CoA lyase, partial [Gemmobacter sp.]